jgi:hypothetical protein
MSNQGKALINAIKGAILANPHIAHGAEPGTMRLTPHGLFIEFFYPATIEGEFEHVSCDLFDLMNQHEAMNNESETR